MREPAVPAPGNKVPAADDQVVGTGDMTVAACGGLHEFPEIVAPDFDEFSFFADIFDPGNEDPGGPAVVAHNLRPVGDRRDDLVSLFSAMITDRPIPRGDETIAHGR